MTSNQIANAAGLGFLAGTALTVYIICAVVYYLLLVVAWWRLFTKAGEKGWKAIIPFYNFYIQIKLTWSKKFFWIILLASIASGILVNCVNPNSVQGLTQAVFGVVCFALGIFLFVLLIISSYRLSKAYGHGGGYTVGLILLNFIFILVLAFGKSEYQGNVYLKNKENAKKAAEKPAETKENETK